MTFVKEGQMFKFTISLISGLLFLAIASPETFKMTKGIFGTWIASPTGCPTGQGLLLHSILYVLLTWLMMNINKAERDDGTDTKPDVKTPTDVKTTMDTIKPYMDNEESNLKPFVDNNVQCSCKCKKI